MLKAAFTKQPDSPKNSRAQITPSAVSQGPAVAQPVRHGIIGTMLEHAPKPGLELPAIDKANELFYPQNKVLASRRGEIRKSPEAKFDWKLKFTELATKIADMRKKTGLPPKDFPIVINANWMISPGYEETPEEYMDLDQQVFAISSVWGFDYYLPSGQVDKEYTSILDGWKSQPDQSSATRTTRSKSAESTNENLGDKAKELLRIYAINKVKLSRNEVIPHRGLRNLFFKDPWFLSKLKNLEERAGYVHVITLDSDTNLGEGDILDEIADFAETDLESGLGITATDYVYERENIFEWFAGLLDKVGRKKLEQNEFDAYPAEPGLTISYSSNIGGSARAFLASDPFGPEYSGDPRDGVFKEFVESSQSVEGKNIREKWRSTYGDPESDIHRTAAYVNVKESQAQQKKHLSILSKIKNPLNKEDIPSDLIHTLISSDTYHSLSRARDSKEKEEAKRRIVEEATAILNDVLKASVATDENELKQNINKRLKTYMAHHSWVEDKDKSNDTSNVEGKKRKRKSKPSSKDKKSKGSE